MENFGAACKPFQDTSSMSPVSDPKTRMTALGKQLFNLKKQKAACEERIKELNKQIEHIATKELPKLLEDTDIDRLHIKGLGTVYLQNEFYCNVLKENRDQLYAWLRETNNGSIIQDWVFPATLKAFVREQYEKGLELPPIVKVEFIPTANTRKGS